MNQIIGYSFHLGASGVKFDKFTVKNKLKAEQKGENIFNAAIQPKYQGQTVVENITIRRNTANTPFKNVLYRNETTKIDSGNRIAQTTCAVSALEKINLSKL